MGSSVIDDVDEERGLSPATLNTLRGILISSLPRENSPIDVLSPPVPPPRRKVTFKEGSRRYSENLLGNQAWYLVGWLGPARAKDIVGRL